MWKKILIPLAISVVTLGALSLAVHRGELNYGILYSVNVLWFIVAALKIPLLFPLWAYRWHAVLKLRHPRLGLKTVAAGVMVRSFFNNITPGVGTGGEPAGAYYISKKAGIPYREVIASVAAERMIMGITLVILIALIAGFSFSLLPLSSTLIKFVLGGLFFFSIFVGVMFYLSIFKFSYAKKIIKNVIRVIIWFACPWGAKLAWGDIEEILDGFHHTYKESVKNRKIMLTVFTITILQVILDIMQPYAIFRALGADVPIITIMVSTAVIKVLGIFSVIPGGSGLVEGANFGIFAVLSSVPAEIIVAETVLFRVLDAWILWLVSGIFTSVVSASLFYGEKRPPPATMLTGL